MRSARPVRRGRGRIGGGRRSRSRPGKSGRGREGARRSKRYAGSGPGRIEGACGHKRYAGSGIGRIAGEHGSTREGLNFQNQSAHLAAQCAPHRLDYDSLVKELVGKAVPGVVARVRLCSCTRHGNDGMDKPEQKSVKNPSAACASEIEHWSTTHDATSLAIWSLLQTQLASVLQVKQKGGGIGLLSTCPARKEWWALTASNQSLSHPSSNSLERREELAFATRHSE
jgi:hypothetical protein